MAPRKAAKKTTKAKKATTKKASPPAPAPPPETVVDDTAEDTRPAKRARTEASVESNEVPSSKPVAPAKNGAAPVVEEPAVAQSNESDAQASQDTDETKLSGKFDIYGMYLPFLSKAFLPPGTSQPQYEKLYDTILTYQAKPDYTARCFIPDAPYLRSGVMKSREHNDPMECMPFDIAIEDLKEVDKLPLTAAQKAEFISPSDDLTTGPGVMGNLVLEDDHCGIQSAGGKFLMKRLWVKEGDAGSRVELFEGFMSFKVSYSGMYRRKGHGSGFDIPFAFWAVRARKGADGKEIGVGP